MQDEGGKACAHCVAHLDIDHAQEKSPRFAPRALDSKPASPDGFWT
jgi:hypothetical protein